MPIKEASKLILFLAIFPTFFEPGQPGFFLVWLSISKPNILFGGCRPTADILQKRPVAVPKPALRHPANAQSGFYKNRISSNFSFARISVFISMFNKANLYKNPSGAFTDSQFYTVFTSSFLAGWVGAGGCILLKNKIVFKYFTFGIKNLINF